MHSRVWEHEPELAIFVPAEDPLIFYRAIAGYAAFALRPGGKIFVEINRAYAKEIVDLFSIHNFSAIEVRKDFLDNDRMISATLLS